MMNYVELLENYKNRQPDRDWISPYYREHIIYWILLKMIHLGKPELLSVIAKQLGLDNHLRVKMAIQAIRDNDGEFPLSIGKQRHTRRETVHIDPNTIPKLREAADQVSPEHMPPDLVLRHLDDVLREEGSEYFFHIFSSEENSFPATELISLLHATDGIDNAQILERNGNKKMIQVLIPNIQVIILPVVGDVESGYFSDREHVLDIRDAGNRLATASYPRESTLTVIVSIGFTQEARISCLDTPKVLLMELWAFLKLIGRLQKTNKRVASQRALVFINDALLETTGEGHFYPDGFVTKTISELLDVKYPVS